ncbi:hypothetical protein CLAIMM_08366 [Cladophialophora immunda]|nr:hypothetical protein CLAIMM_08366 [Cladophialophora immunda]
MFICSTSRRCRSASRTSSPTKTSKSRTSAYGAGRVTGIDGFPLPLDSLGCSDTFNDLIQVSNPKIRSSSHTFSNNLSRASTNT